MKRIIDVHGNKLIVFYRIIVGLLLLMVVLLIAGSLFALFRSRDSGPLFRIGSAVKDGPVRDGGTGRGGQDGGVREGNAVSEDTAFREGETAFSIFSGIGMLRIQNTGKPQASGKAGQNAAPVEALDPAVIIISISFPYKTDDRPFAEELASNLGKFRSIATNYFANLPRDTLTKLDEEQAKTEILRQYNALLRLGRIETLYFGDLMIVE